MLTRIKYNDPTRKETVIFPQCCTSAYCGIDYDCSTCMYRELNKEFHAWREKHRAIRLDEIRSPSVWTATV